MIKALKILGLSFVLLLVAIGGVAAYLYQTRPTRLTPYPYTFTKTEWEGLAEAEQAQVLLVGDRMGHRLAGYLNKIQEATSDQLAEPLRVYSWARQSEGLHRTLEKLRQLKRWPSVLIFHGLSQELEEQRFYLKDKSWIVRNFQLYEHDQMQSLLLAAPVLSRFVYWPHELVRFDEYTPYQIELEDTIQQERMALTYFLLRHEIRELIQLARQNQSHLILVTTPVNLEVAPRKVCANADTPTIQAEQRDIRALLDQGLTKEAFARASELVRLTPGNAQSFYLRGLSALELADYSVAQGALQLAAVYDCEPWRAHAIMNQGLIQQADQTQTTLIDFDFLVNQNIGRDHLFLDNLFPHEAYYLKASNELVKEVKQFFRLK